MYLHEFIAYYTDGHNHYTGQELPGFYKFGDFIPDDKMYEAMCKFIELTDKEGKEN